MNDLAILIDHGQSAFTPGSTLSGSIRWQLDSPPRELQLQLLWYTSGKGTTDVGVADSRRFTSSQPSGSENFSFILPESPYSFSGKLISVQWALELLVRPGSLSHKIPFTLSPSGAEIVLPELAQSAPSGFPGQFMRRSQFP